MAVSPIFIRISASILSLVFLLPVATAGDNPINPFDYNFCGGERVYPVVGIEFSTSCGPRNMVALGRRGKLSWFFPDSHGSGQGDRKGIYRLSDQQLLDLSRLAEVVQIAQPPAPMASPVQYKLGLNFSGRPFQRVHTGLTDKYSPSTRLFRRLLELVPDKPYLPECGGEPVIFDPIKTRSERLKIYGSLSREK